ncbi:hypothetical protein Taro_012148 [Colocasia esculenta]|uniref:Uncharacterized protein n=1 Tax=Colocasia esculenta TaxID=4460 RepID=A0A843U3A7_COLES|nr:hypothetical protein [Colocasia esculenta]
MYRSTINHVSFHSFLSAKDLRRRKGMNPEEIDPCGCDRPRSVANYSSNEISSPRAPLMELSRDSDSNVTNFDAPQHFSRHERWTNRNQVDEMNFRRPTHDTDNICELALCTFRGSQLHDGYEDARERESMDSILHLVDRDHDVMDAHAGESEDGHAAHSCYHFGGCINLELTIS